MFDVGFTELLVIATITLLVLGPERMPEAVRTVTLWIGRFKRSLRETRREIEQQIGADDIRRELHNEEVMQNLEKLRGEVDRTLEEDIALESELYPTSGNRAKADGAMADADKPEDPTGTEPGRPQSPATPESTPADQPEAGGEKKT
ncbi:Sec-independent protein translocase protein TatB [Gilvimarinus sp. F26214L]|uniref:Sec-independent protein translocase protein TatB n=1 Tax=Gilvimarinus sp. DZF01 TaxID=3461371 RepID=UPI0040459269